MVAASHAMPPLSSHETGRLAAPLAIDIDTRNRSVTDRLSYTPVDTETVLRSGWLYKKGGRPKSWRKRWFVLRKDGFAYYKDQNEYETRKIVRIEAVSGITSKLYGKRTAISFYIGDKHVHLLAVDTADAAAWVTAFKAATKFDGLSSSMATTPVDIGGIPRSLVSVDSQSPPIWPRVMSISPSMQFSDDDLSPALMSEDDFASPVSASTTRHEGCHLGAVAGSPLGGQHELKDKVIMQGYLKRLQSIPMRGSTTVWGVLRPYGLYLYPDQNEYSPSKIIPFADMIDASDLTTEAELSGSHSQSHKRKKEKFRFQVITSKKAMRFSVDREEALDDWLGGLKSRLEKRELQQGPGGQTSPN